MIKTFTNISKLGDAVNKLVQLKRITNGTRGYGGLGAKPPATGRFFVIFLEKIATLMPFGSHFARFQSHLKKQNF